MNEMPMQSQTSARSQKERPPGPIFLGGADRSGKTLVRWMLSSLPDVMVTRRTELWPRFYRRFGNLDDPRNLDRCLEAMLARKQVAALSPDPERLRCEFRRGPATYPRLFALVHEHYAQRQGKKRWGDQTGYIERFANELMEAYPGAKIVHLIRDPRDSYQAVVERDGYARGSVGSHTGRWMTSVALARRNRTRHPGSYLVITYEKLVARPEETMRSVCDFIDERFDPSLLLLDGVRRYKQQRAEVDGGSPISDRDVGRFRETIAPWDLAFIQRVAGKQMNALGYVKEPIRMTPLQRARDGAKKWPPALARMGGRRLLDALGEFPSASRTRTVSR
jgi:hypothetical protein